MRRRRRAGLHLVLTALAIAWLFPLGWAVIASLRPYAETAAHGYLSWPSSLSLVNYEAAWSQAELPRFMLNTIGIVVPAVILTLIAASAVAFVLARFSWRLNLTALLALVAANLLPPQILAAPIFRL